MEREEVTLKPLWFSTTSVPMKVLHLHDVDNPYSFTIVDGKKKNVSGFARQGGFYLASICECELHTLDKLAGNYFCCLCVRIEFYFLCCSDASS